MPISEEYKRKFINTVVLCKPNMIYVDIDNNTLNRIDVFAKEIIKKKSKEKHHKIDNASEYTRFFTGMIGECAVEKIFHRSMFRDSNFNGISWRGKTKKII